MVNFFKNIKPAPQTPQPLLYGRQVPVEFTILDEDNLTEELLYTNLSSREFLPYEAQSFANHTLHPNVEDEFDFETLESDTDLATDLTTITNWVTYNTAPSYFGPDEKLATTLVNHKYYPALLTTIAGPKVNSINAATLQT